MSGQVVRLPSALIDLENAADFIRRQSSPERAIRFLREADRTFERLAKMPGIGTRYLPDDPRFLGIRYFPLSRFKAFIVFYMPMEGGIQVWHIIHGARNFEGLLSDELSEIDDSEDLPNPETPP
jgi:plasmid stabilization system protein ParE